eukprot:scaffold5770_cov388-Prasinococcus_capsulatus_cf.AAC.1
MARPPTRGPGPRGAADGLVGAAPPVGSCWSVAPAPGEDPVGATTASVARCAASVLPARRAVGGVARGSGADKRPAGWLLTYSTARRMG